MGLPQRVEHGSMTTSPSGGQDRGTIVPAWLPNLISMVRIGLVPLFVVVLQWCQEIAQVRGTRPADMAHLVAEDTAALASARLFAVFILFVVCVSDLLDGFLARTFGLQTNRGAALDAFADKLVQVFALAFFTFFTFSTDSAFPAVPLWFFVLVLGRDIVLGAGCLILQSRVGVAYLEHQFHGKATTVILLLVILLYTVNLESLWLDRVVLFASGIVVLSTLAYLSEGMAQLRKGTASGTS